MNHVRRSYVLLHLSIVLWGFTAILGALISLSAVALVWWRVAITSTLLYVFPAIRKELRRLPRETILRYFWIGILVGMHWLCFFGSIKYANASVALITMSTTTLFTAFLEPLVLKSRLDKWDIGISLLVIPAMFLTAGKFEGGMISGFWLGILAAVLLAYFTILNKKSITEASPGVITFIEMGAAWFFISLCFPIYYMLQGPVALMLYGSDLIYILILSIGCTLLPFILHLDALRHISAFTTNLIINLEPVYGIIMAIIILKEHKELNSNFYLGAILIVGITMIYPFRKRQQVVRPF